MPNLTRQTPLLALPHRSKSPLLTQRQKRRRFKKAVVSTGFGGKQNLNIQSVSRRGVKDRMVFWAKGCTIEGGLRISSGLGIIGKTCPDPDQWVRDAYLITYGVHPQIAQTLAVAMALKIAKHECDKLAEIERPSIVVIYSSAKDALLGIQESTYVMLSGVRMPKAAVRVVEAGLVAAYFLRKLEVEVELQWFPDGCETEAALESNRAACEGAKYTRPLKGPDAFIMDVQAANKRKKKRRLRRIEAKERKQEASIVNITDHFDVYHLRTLL